MALQHQRPFDLVSYSKLQPVTASSQRFKKRISAPILVAASKTGDSASSGTAAMQMETVGVTVSRTPTLSTLTPHTPITPYYHNPSTRSTAKPAPAHLTASGYPSISGLSENGARDSVEEQVPNGEGQGLEHVVTAKP